MNIIIIEKDGNVYEKQIKTMMMDKLYSVCGYRTNKDFEKLHEWIFDQNIYELYGKKSGKKDKENTFQLPELDTQKDYKFYGSLCIVKKNGSISMDEWNMFYMSFTNKDSKKISKNDADTETDNDTINDTDNDTYGDEKEFNDFENEIEMDSIPKYKFAKIYETINDREPELELTYEEYEEE